MKTAFLALFLVTTSTFGANQGLNWQIWKDLSAEPELSVLKNHPNFPAKPDFDGVIQRFDFHANLADYYGCKVMGYLTPAETGEYTFYISADDEGELLLSSDKEEKNKKVIASNATATGWQNWDVQPTQKSKPIKLEAGKKYYIEALFKESAGDEYLAVAWESNKIERQIISDKYLTTINDYNPEEEFIVPTKKTPLKNDDLAAYFKMAIQIKQSHEPPADQVKPHPAGNDFPGAVDASAPRVTESIMIDGSYSGNNSRYCFAGMAGTALRSTGLYAAPGEKITVKIPDWCKSQGLGVQIGCHTDHLWHLKKIQRVPAICRWDQLDEATTYTASSFGGIIYITVPADKTLGLFEAKISGGVKLPWYIHGKTTLKEWVEQVRNHPAPMAELQTEKMIITLPAKFIRNLENPVTLMNFWDDVMDACADLSAVSRQRPRAERMVFDRQISAGWMHSGYPLMGPNVMADKVVNEKHMREKGDWGCYHEIGHNHQCSDWVLPNETEVSVNFYSAYVYDKVHSRHYTDTHGAIKSGSREKSIKRFLENGKKGPFTSLQTYLILKDAFGWELFQKVFADYNYLSSEERPKQTQDKVDRFIETFSRFSGYNLVPYFESWGYKISDKTKKRCSNFREWKENPMPEYLKKFSKKQ